MSRVPVVLSLILFSAWILLTRAVENQATLRDDSGVGFDSTTKEGILANRERRKQQLKNLVNGMRKQLADHSAGEKTLSPDEKETMERRLHLFQQKIESMKKDLDDRDIERIIAREESSAQRRRDRKPRSRDNGGEL